MFGISGSEFLVIILVAVIVVGPQRLPEYTRKLTQMVRQLRIFLDNARTQVAEEVGPELADLDLSSLDPRQYDPRKIVRDALGEDIDAIRKDLTHPFKSVADAAKETSDAAAKAANDAVRQERASSLGRRISEKKAEAAATAAAGAVAAAASGSPGEAGGQDGSPPEPVTAPLEEAAPKDLGDAVPRDAAGERQPEAGRASGGDGPREDQEEAAGEAAASREDATRESEATDPGPVRDPDRARVLGAGAADGGQVQEEPGEAAEEPGEEDRLAVQDWSAVPTSLVPSSQPGGAHGPGGTRPVSPREIVRAANAAARTRAQAAAAFLET